MGDEPLPLELQTITGVGKTILIERRRLFRLGLVHSDDEPNVPGWTLTEQIRQLDQRARVELRSNK